MDCRKSQSRKRKINGNTVKLEFNNGNIRIRDGSNFRDSINIFQGIKKNSKEIGSLNVFWDDT